MRVSSVQMHSDDSSSSTQKGNLVCMKSEPAACKEALSLLRTGRISRHVDLLETRPFARLAPSVSMATFQCKLTSYSQCSSYGTYTHTIHSRKRRNLQSELALILRFLDSTMLATPSIRRIVPWKDMHCCRSERCKLIPLYWTYTESGQRYLACIC